MQGTERDTHFMGFAKLLMEELDIDLVNDFTMQIIAQRAYDLVNHTLWHSTPASGSTIKKYQGMTIDEITQSIPDLTEWPIEPGSANRA